MNYLPTDAPSTIIPKSPPLPFILCCSFALFTRDKHENSYDRAHINYQNTTIARVLPIGG